MAQRSGRTYGPTSADYPTASQDHCCRSTQIRSISPQIRNAIARLLEAHRYAKDARCPDWEFAIPLASLLSDGLTLNDCHWLIRKGYVEVGCEKTPACSGRREISPCPTQALARDECANHACLVITSAGSALARQVAGYVTSAGNESVDSWNPRPMENESSLRPQWDAERRELRVGGEVIKRFRTSAPNQEAVLAAFEEEGWPHHIHDPLRQRSSNEESPKRRLNDTVKGLNRRQIVLRIRFYADGTGEGVCWEMLGEPTGDPAR